MSKFFKIKQASELTGINLETIRYYEKQGLIRPILREQNGYRLFDDNQLQQLRFIKNCRNIGFSLKDIKALLELQANPDNTCTTVSRLADEHLAHLDEKIAQLQEIKSFLERFSGCQNHTVSQCTIIEGIKQKKPDAKKHRLKNSNGVSVPTKLNIQNPIRPNHILMRKVAPCHVG